MLSFRSFRERFIFCWGKRAGKSTLIKILSGAYQRESGEIFLNGRLLPPLTPRQVLEHGIRVIYQEFNLFPELPIYENIFSGRDIRKGILVDRKEEIRQARQVMAQVGLHIPPQTLVKELSVAQKQLVEIAKAISASVQVLVLDEPTAALTDKETELLFQVIRKLKKDGIGIIYISHRMSEFFQIGDRCTVMRNGTYIDTVRIADTNAQELTSMMVGHKILASEHKARNHRCNTKEVLSVQNLCLGNRLKHVSFVLHKGEILGMTGLIGSGCAETIQCIMGITQASSGQVLYQGNPASSKLADNIRNGMVYLSDDRKEEGLIQIHSVMDNISLPSLKRLARPFLKKKTLSENADRYIRQLGIKTHSRLTEVQYLSGGNQQKIVIAKWLCAGADLYIFHEPTRGIDVSARAEIYRIIGEIVSRGASVLVISSDLQELMQLSDRIMVMKDGEVRAVLDNDHSLTQKKILEYAMQEEVTHIAS